MKTLKIMKILKTLRIHENHTKSMKIYENHKKNQKINEILQNQQKSFKITDISSFDLPDQKFVESSGKVRGRFGEGSEKREIP